MRVSILIIILFLVDNSFGQPNCDTLFSIAKKTYDVQGAKQAIEIYTKIISLKCDKLSMAYNNRGFLTNEIEDYQNAITDFEQALKIDPSNSDAYANESTSYNMLDNYLMATLLIDKAIKLDPNNYQYYRLKGDVKYSEEKFDSAIINYKISISLKPDFLKLYTLIARVYEKENRVAMDRANSNKNINRANADSAGQILANSTYANRDSAEAILTLLINRFPQNKLLIYNRADFYRRNFLYDKAIPDYLKGLKENEPDCEEVSNLANCYDGNGDYKAAIEYYTKSIAIKPNPIAYANRGRRYRKLGKFKEAISDEENVIKLDSTYAQAYLIIGNCYLDLKQPKKAHSYYQRGLAQKPEGGIKELLEMQLANTEQ